MEMGSLSDDLQLGVGGHFGLIGVEEMDERVESKGGW